jgi:hypothetical protein
MRRAEMSEVQEAWLAVAELLGNFARKSLSPCTTLALGNLALVSGHHGDPTLTPARQRAGERRDEALERAFEIAMSV